MNKKLGDVYTLPSMTATPADAYLSDGMHFGEVQRNHPQDDDSLYNCLYLNNFGKPTEKSSTEIIDSAKPGGSKQSIQPIGARRNANAIRLRLPSVGASLLKAGQRFS